MSEPAIDDIDAYIRALGENGRVAARRLATASPASKNAALLGAAQKIRQRAGEILDINTRDVEAATTRGQTPAFIDRMALNADRIESICAALETIAGLPDPVGEEFERWTRPNGLEISRVRTPIGVIAVIYESRPNVTVDAAAISLKAGNATILRGGSECFGTARALFEAMHGAIVECGLPAAAVQFVETRDRKAVSELLSGLGGVIDLVIPRGGKSLVKLVQEEARAPVLSHLDGVCHVYVDKSADRKKAVKVIENAKLRRTGVCGAAETLLIDRAIAREIWPEIAAQLRAGGCELRGDAELLDIDPSVLLASEEDYYTEYLAPILSVAVVDGVNGAIAHIEKYSSGHTESIVAEDSATAAQFLSEVDSAIVMHNTSTQFADGGEFGLGAEIGIATGRLHARGPVGVRELTSYKNIVRGSGQIRP